jgi:hypothetical protein
MIAFNRHKACEPEADGESPDDELLCAMVGYDLTPAQRTAIRKTMPRALAKSFVDTWHYVAILRTGHAIEFTSATFVDDDAEWIWLDGELSELNLLAKSEFCPGRGCEVRLSEIAVVMDGDS